MRNHRIAIPGLLLGALLLAVPAWSATLWGTEQTTGNIYAIDTLAMSATLVDSTTDVIAAPSESSPNGNAIDGDSQRFYFTSFELQSSLEALPSELYFNDLDTGDNQVAGQLDMGVSAGAFHDGAFYYIAHASDDLHRVELDGDGLVVVDQKLVDLTGDQTVWGFGDIAFSPGGVLFGSATVRGPAPGGAVIGRELFRYVPQTASYTTLAAASCEQVDGQLVCTGPWWGQIAFADDGALWGHDSNTGDFFTIDTATGARSAPLFNLDMIFTDLAALLPPAGDLIVAIDAKPGSYPNSMNINGRGKIPVAVLGSAEFDVSRVDASTLTFGGMPVNVKRNGQVHCAMSDVSGDFATPQGAPDGFVDLVCHFLDVAELWVANPDGTATLQGSLDDGTPFEGADEVSVKQPRGKKRGHNKEQWHPRWMP